MNCYQNMISDLCKKIIEGQLPYKDTILLGDNSSGKSDVLKNIIDKSDKRNFYFIDAVNREFDVKQISFDKKSIEYSTKINENRLREDIFNHKDSFYYGGTPRAIEDLYFNYRNEIEKLMQNFLQIKFEVRQKLTGAVVYVNDEEFVLSSGYQALIRMFLELLYYKDTMNEGTIVIDELDEFLSVKNCGRIFDFLRMNFSTFQFVVTTHSADLVAGTEDANIVLLRNTNYEVLDAGDFRSISQVYDLFKDIFKLEEEKTSKDIIDTKLRVLFNNKMSGIWDEENEAELSDIKTDKITKVQKMIIKQIEEWKA